MNKYLLIAFITLFLSSLAVAQDTLTTLFFPYQPGDILVYSISGLVERPDDSKIIFTRDSVTENGDRYLFLEHEGYTPVAKGFKVDTAENVYAANWWDRPDYWHVFNASNGMNTPWVVYEGYPGLEGDLVLGRITEETSDQGFNIESAVKAVHIYNAGDTTDTTGYDFNTTYWKAGFGITRKFNYEGGPTYNLKGAVIDGQVYGDTAMYRVPPPSTVQKDYFPYKVGDVVVYNVTDSMGSSLPDSRIEFVSDSVDTEGNIWYSLKTKGYQPVVKEFMVDTAKNIYATGWWQGNEEPWKVFDAYFDSGTPWIVINNEEDTYELGDIRTVVGRDWLFGEQQFWYNAVGPIVEVRYYEAEDSTIQGYDAPNKIRAKWDDEFGIIYKHNLRTRTSYEIKGAFVNGELRGDTAAVITSSESNPATPSGIALYQNYPNPFNPSTTITYQMEQPGQVTIKLYSITGQLVKELLHTYNTSGTYSFQLNGSNLSSGMYILRGRLGEQTESRTLMLIK